MSDLISRDALFAEFENAGWYDLADRDEIAEELLLHAPTVDAVPVWCEECKLHGSCTFEETFITAGLAENRRYCGAGERKDGEKWTNLE